MAVGQVTYIMEIDFHRIGQVDWHDQGYDIHAAYYYIFVL